MFVASRLSSCFPSVFRLGVLGLHGIRDSLETPWGVLCAVFIAALVELLLLGAMGSRRFSGSISLAVTAPFLGLRLRLRSSYL